MFFFRVILKTVIDERFSTAFGEKPSIFSRERIFRTVCTHMIIRSGENARCQNEETCVIFTCNKARFELSNEPIVVSLATEAK